jgi:hypothetical protein
MPTPSTSDRAPSDNPPPLLVPVLKDMTWDQQRYAAQISTRAHWVKLHYLAIGTHKERAVARINPEVGERARLGPAGRYTHASSARVQRSQQENHILFWSTKPDESTHLILQVTNSRPCCGNPLTRPDPRSHTAGRHKSRSRPWLAH